MKTMSNGSDTSTTALARLPAEQPPSHVAPRGYLMPRNFQELIEVAKLLSQSSLVPDAYRGKPADVVVAMQMGAEVGLSPMQALQNISIINGRPSLWGDAAMAVVRAHPACQDVLETFDAETQTATCTVIRRGSEPVSRTFSVADAEAAGLTNKKGPWQQYRQRMLQMRARGFALRDSFPDALRGLITREEAEDYPTADERPRRWSPR